VPEEGRRRPFCGDRVGGRDARPCGRARENTRNPKTTHKKTQHHTNQSQPTLKPHTNTLGVVFSAEIPVAWSKADQQPDSSKSRGGWPDRLAAHYKRPGGGFVRRRSKRLCRRVPNGKGGGPAQRMALLALHGWRHHAVVEKPNWGGTAQGTLPAELAPRRVGGPKRTLMSSKTQRLFAI